MHKRTALLATVVAAVSMGIRADAASWPPASVPHTPAATRSAAVIARAESAFAAYLAACSSQSARDLLAALTDDAVVEYASQNPGTYRMVDAFALIGEVTDASTRDAGAQQVSGVWIYPTNDANVVFVQYEAQSGPASLPGTRKQPQLVMLEMRGDRIARMRSFGPRD